MRETLALHKNKRLALARRIETKPDQYHVPQLPARPTIKKVERKPLSPVEAALPYQEYDAEARKGNFTTYYDPLFNPHLYEERHRVNPDEEPFNAIYSANENNTNENNKSSSGGQQTESSSSSDYTQVRNITSPELWKFVERLGRIKVAPQPRRRKAGEPIEKLPSGFVPPPETAPELPYFVARTRNHLLPVYYQLHSDPNECKTLVKQVTGDLWKLEEDLRSHLEALSGSNRRILSSVQEPDERIEFRGRYLHQVVDWLHAQGF